MADAALDYLQGPCGVFVTDDEVSEEAVCRAAYSGDPAGASTVQLAELRAAATDVVWVLLGRPNMGVCTATIYPCQHEHIWRHWVPQSDRYFSLSHNENQDAIKLDTPVVDVTDVTVDGATLPSSEYVLVDQAWLIRTDGATWPAGSVDDYADFSITYTFGSTPPPLVRDATIEIVKEMWDTRPGHSRDVPGNATNVSRQGISFSPDRDHDRYREMGPSLPNLMKAISVYNPGGHRFPTMVWSPDSSHRNRSIRSF